MNRINKKFLPFIIFGSISGILIIFLNEAYLKFFFLVSGNIIAYYFLHIFSFLLIFFPIFLSFYLEHSRKKEMEEVFPIFLKDLVESLRGGMSLPFALRNLRNNDYKSLSPLVKRLYYQIAWGVPAEDALRMFADKTGSKFIKRIILSILESNRYGGNLASIIDSLSKTALEADRLRMERKLFLQSQLITAYIIFFVFIGVVIGLQKFLVPALVGEEVKVISEETEKVGAEFYFATFRDLIIIQGFFCGLLVGKMTEGAIINGLKHSIIMIILGLLIFFFATELI